MQPDRAIIARSRATLHIPAPGVIAFDTRDRIPPLGAAVDALERFLALRALALAAGESSAVAALLGEGPERVAELLGRLAFPAPYAPAGAGRSIVSPRPGVLVIDATLGIPSLRAAKGACRRVLVDYAVSVTGSKSGAARALGLAPSSLSMPARGGEGAHA